MILEGCILVLAVGLKQVCGRGSLEVLSHDSDNEYAMLDTTIVRAHQHSAGKNQAIGRSKGGLSTKIHARTDALGNPTGFYHH